MDNLGLTRNLSSFDPSHGVTIGSNPNQPETDIELEVVIKALRLINVGDMCCAEKVIGDANFSKFVKDWLNVEIRAILSIIDKAG
ncbi:MAG: hypothetical protein EOO52_12870 [Gammaproteobacteria bacterium]|nr:MAG: hypothetical protein EOO52_12870 [Gammaproteobacteria bacterium]